MTWLGLRHKGVEILFPEEWNAVVDGLDILYGYVSDLEDRTVKKEDLLSLPSDIIPDQDNIRDLGDPSKAWRDVYAHYGYFSDNLLVQGKQVLKDGDPVQVYRFIDEARADIDTIYNVLLDTKTQVDSVKQELDLVRLYVEEIYRATKRPTGIDTLRLVVGTSPVPLSDIDLTVKRIHIKVPSWTLYLVYLGNSAKQDFVLEPGDKETLEIENPKNVYVRSLGNVEIFVAFEV